MPEVSQNYNFNSLYIVWIIILYNIFTTNYDYIKLCINKIMLFDHISIIIFVNVIGIYLFLKNITFEINFTISYRI